ncbi:MAG: hypothetical protein ABSB84_05225 [Verrucomicrobiota bacterium]|jgi:hypothetical protein
MKVEFGCTINLKWIASLSPGLRGTSCLGTTLHKKCPTFSEGNHIPNNAVDIHPRKISFWGAVAKVAPNACKKSCAAAAMSHKLWQSRRNTVGLSP